MSASGIYALKFPVEAGNPKPLRDIAEAAARIAQQTKLSAGEFKIFEDELARSIASGAKLSATLNRIAREFQGSTPALKNFTTALRDEVGKNLDAVSVKANTAVVSIDRMERSLGRIGGRIGGQLGIGGSGGFIGGQLGSIFGLGLGGGLAFAGVGAIADYIEKTAKVSQETSKLADRLQITRGAASEVVQAFAAAGLQTTEYASSVEELGRALDAGGVKSQAMVSAVRSLGISFTDAFGKGRGDADVFSDLVHKVAGMTDDAKRSFIALYATIDGSGAADKLREQAAAIDKQNTSLATLGLTLKDITSNTKSWTEQLFDVLGLLGNIAKWKPSRFLTLAGSAMTGGSAVDSLLGFGDGATSNDRYGFSRIRTSPFSGSLSEQFGAISAFVSEIPGAGRGGSAQYRIPTTHETLARAVSEARAAYDKALNKSTTDQDKGVTDTDTITADNQALALAQSRLDAAQRAADGLRSGTSLAKRRQQLREELSQEGAKPGSLARFQYKYRDLRNGSAQDQAAYYSAFQDLFSQLNDRKIKTKEVGEFSADRAVSESGLKSTATIGHNFFTDFPGLSGITSAGLPPASASILSRGLQSQLRFRSRLSRIGNDNPEAGARAELQDTIQTIQQEQAEREKELAAEQDSAEKLGKIADLRQKYLNAIGDAENEYTLRLKEIAEERKRSFGDTFSGFVLAAQHGGARGFLRGQGEGIESKILGNLASNFIFPKIQSIIPHAGNSNSTIGKLLAGTPFAAHEDPLKTSTDLNTKSTDFNTAALLAFQKQLGGSGTLPGFNGGVTFSGIPGLSTYGSDINGITGSSSNAISNIVGPARLSKISSIVSGLGSGAAMGVGHLGALTSGQVAKDGFGYNLSTTQRIGAGVGDAAAAFGAYAGVKEALKGGAKNITGGIADTAMAVAPFTGPAAPFVMAGAAALKLVSTLLGDPKQQRMNQISKTMFTSQYLAPQAINLQTGVNGGYSDVDEFGNVRTSNLSPYPIVSNSYLDVPRRTDVPGHTISPFGGYSNQTGAQVSVTVHAMDSKSFTDHADDIAGAVQHAMKSNYQPLIKTIRDQL
jgi:hypothetical protein